MWDRTILKSNAKMALTGHFWVSYAACLIVLLISEIFFIAKYFYTDPADLTDPFSDFAWQGQLGYWLPAFLLTIFVTLPFLVGLAGFFVRNRFGVTNLKTIFSGFRCNYFATLGSMASTFLLVCFGLILFIVPGIILGLKYCMVRFLLSDNPSMSGKRARQISSMMTDGEKGTVFVLLLSFLGWYLLAWVIVTLVAWFAWPVTGLAAVAVLSFLVAYMESTMTELYIFMRDRAIRSGIVNPAELNLVPPAERENFS